MSLGDAVAEAVAHNPEVVMRLQAVRVQRGAGRRSLAPAPPTVSVDYAFIPRGRGIGAFGERTVEISQTIDFPSTIYWRGRQASAEIGTAEAEWISARNEIAGRVKAAYYTVLARKAKLLLAEENLALAAEFARTTGIRRSVGEGTRLEQLTSDVQKSQAANDLDAARAQVLSAMNDLRLLMGRPSSGKDAPMQLTDSLAYRAFPFDAGMLEADAARSNPAVRSSLLRRESASFASTLAWTSWLPSLSASYYSQTRDGETGLYGVSFGVSIPVWFFLDQGGRIEESAANLSIAESAHRYAVDSVTVSVTNAVHEITASEHQLKRYMNELSMQADEILRSARVSYEAGEIGYLEFLAARQTFLQTRSASIDALLNYNLALVRLEQAIGQTLGDTDSEGVVK